MVNIKYDVSDVEDFTPYAGPTPKRGIYEARVSSGEFTTSSNGNDMFKFVVIIDTKKKEDKQYNGCPLFPNFTIGDLTEEWQKRNLRQVIKTFGLKEKGSLNPDAVVKKATGMMVRVIVKNENSEEYGLQAKANGLLPFKSDDAPEDGAEAEEAEAEAEEVDEAEEADEADAEDDGLDDMNRAALRKYIKENELDIKVVQSKSDDDLRAEIRSLSEEEPEEDEEEEADEEEGTSVEEEIADLDRPALKKFIKDNSLEVKVTTKMSDDDIRAAIVEAWPEEADEEEDSEEEPPF